MILRSDGARRLTLAAPAKINLFLHAGARGPDGYHALVTWVVFAEAADELAAVPAEDVSLAVTGPEAGGLAAGPDNLVLRAAASLGRPGQGARLSLSKTLPVAAGLGGGSADAAAALRLLNVLWGLGLSDEALRQAGLALGADVPMCLNGVPALAEGRGERLSAAPPTPRLDLVLVNPRIPVATADVFRGLDRRSGSARPALPAGFASAGILAAALGALANDLEEPALRLAPAIAAVLNALRAAPGCLLARMSGSGATCFGMFPDAPSARSAAEALRAAHPHWWIVQTRTRDARPEISTPA